MLLTKQKSNYLSTAFGSTFNITITYILLGDGMKNIIKGFFLLLLVCFSFFYTDKVINMINKNDPLMKEIINVKDDYEVLPINGILDDDTIIPGINGRKVDVDKSYEKMKLGGVFREEALVFKDLFPSSGLKDNGDKYIIKGNGYKKNIAIIVILNNNYIDKIKKLDDITIFINHGDLNVNNINLLKEKEIYTYGNNGIYTSEILTSDNALINTISNNKSNYCMLKDKDSEILKLCRNNGMYVIIPNIIGGYYDVKNKLSNGSIILLDNLNDIDVIIKYIKGKGYNIVSLSQLLAE